MRILVISNLYPPYHLSGYELGCQNIVESLKTRGHNIRVLTSTYGVGKAQIKGDVYRWLKKDFKETSDWHPVFLKEVINQTVFKRLCREFLPDIVFIFNLSHVSISLSLLAQEMDLPTCYYISNNWFATLEKDYWYQVWPKGKSGFKLLRYLSHRFNLIPASRPLNPSHLIFTSNYLKDIAIQLGKSEARASVINWGIDTHRFSYEGEYGQKPSRLLYVGQIRHQKSIDIAVKALGLLKREYGYDDLSMTIAGDDKSSSYYIAYLRDLAKIYGVQENISFISLASLENMPDLYHAHDILISSSACEDGLNIAKLEAMSCGLAIVSTATDSNSEILKDEFNALVFPKENPRLCAQQIRRLLKEPMLFESIRTNARSTIGQRFRIEKSVDSIEQVLKKAAGQAQVDRKRIALKRRHLSAETDSTESITELVNRARKWLKLSVFVVLARNLVRPRFIIPKVRKALREMLSFIALLIFPVFYKAFFSLAGRRRKNSKIDACQLRKVLVIQLTDIGDIILTSPFLRELRRFLPHAWIVLVVQPSMFNLVEKCPYVDEVLLFHWRAVKNWKTSFYGHILWWLQASWITMRSLWKHQLDIAISLRWNNDPCLAASLILMYSSGVPQRIAYLDAPHGLKRYSLKGVSRLITQGPVRRYFKHEIELQRDILHFLGANPIDTSLEVWTTNEDERFAQNVLNQYGISDTDLLIAFAPGAVWSFRRWPLNRFIELGKWLQENYNAHILIIAGKGERRLGAQLERGLQSKRTINLAGKTSLREMASVFKYCKLFVGNDSGPMHVAAAVGVPVVGLFGPGEFERFKPWGVNHEVIGLGLSCSPCSENCIYNEPRCIKGITVSQVKRSISRLLNFFR